MSKPPQAEPRKILVVEDDAVGARILCRHLESDHFKVFTTGNGADALTLAEEHQPDLIILDLGLSHDPSSASQFDGRQLLMWLRGYTGRRCPIIVITGEDESVREKVLKAGAIAFFTKPASYPAVLAAVRAALGMTETASTPVPEESAPSTGGLGGLFKKIFHR